MLRLDNFAKYSEKFDFTHCDNFFKYWSNLTFIVFLLPAMPNAQQAVWRKRGCCLVGHFAGFWEFCSRPSLTNTPACRQAAKTLCASGGHYSVVIKGVVCAC